SNPWQALLSLPCTTVLAKHTVSPPELARSVLAYVRSEMVERRAFGRARIGVLPPLGGLVETYLRRLWLAAPHLSTPQPEQVTGRFATPQASAQHRPRQLELLGAQIGLQHSVLKHLPLRVAAPYACQLVEAWLDKERLHEPDRLVISTVRKGMDALYQGE